MESTLERAERMAGTQLTKMRWALGLSGLLAIALGVVILVWPGISLFALTIVFGAYALATGVVGLPNRSRLRRAASAGGSSSRACSGSPSVC